LQIILKLVDVCQVLAETVNKVLLFLKHGVYSFRLKKHCLWYDTIWRVQCAVQKLKHKMD